MLMNPEDFPLVPMDWFYSNTEMGLIVIPENVQTMQVWMEMTAVKEDWSLKNDFPGTGWANLKTTIKGDICFLDCFKREFGLRYPNGTNCTTPWKRTILGLPEPNETENDHCPAEEASQLVNKENLITSEVLFNSPCSGKLSYL